MSFEAPQALLLAIPLALLVWTLGRIAPPASWLRWALVPLVALARPVLDRGGDAMDMVVVVERAPSAEGRFSSLQRPVDSEASDLASAIHRGPATRPPAPGATRSTAVAEGLRP
jgi:hypothetical protein